MSHEWQRSSNCARKYSSVSKPYMRGIAMYVRLLTALPKQDRRRNHLGYSRGMQLPLTRHKTLFYYFYRLNVLTGAATQRRLVIKAEPIMDCPTTNDRILEQKQVLLQELIYADKFPV